MIFQGVVTLIVVRLVKGKWFDSLIRAINTKKFGEDTVYSMEQCKLTGDEIRNKCSYEGIFDLNDKVES